MENKDISLGLFLFRYFFEVAEVGKVVGENRGLPMKNRTFVKKQTAEIVSTKLFSIVLLGGMLLWGGLQTAHGQLRTEAYLEVGSPVPGARGTYGLAAVTDWRVAPWVSLQGGFRLANAYPSGWGDLQVGARFFLQRQSEQWSCQNLINFSYYGPYPMNQLYDRLTFAWQSSHFRVELGNAFAFFVGSGVVKYHLFRPSFWVQGSLKKEDDPWNLAFFIRNFNRFEAHGSRCVEWGAQFSARVARRWSVFCEPYVVTTGNFNGTATFYHFNCLLGGAYLW